jgi:hypothetical protein
MRITNIDNNDTTIFNKFSLELERSLGITRVRGRCGGILVVEPPKYPHIPSLPQEIPKEQFGRVIGNLFGIDDTFT